MKTLFKRNMFSGVFKFKPRLVVAAFAAAAAYVLISCSTEGPKQLVVGKHTCAHCGMHISYPSFAGQAQFGRQKTLFFDDPGCVFLYLEEQQASLGESYKSPTAVYFHHMERNLWIAEQEVGFVVVPESPMGYNLGAVLYKSDPNTNTMTFAEAKERILKQVSDWK